MTRKGRLFYCVGLPRSGKSGVCDAWVSLACASIDGPGADPRGVPSWPRSVAKGLHERHGVQNPRVVVAGDDFRTALHGKTYLPEAEGLVFAAMDVATRALLARGFDVIVDETCTTEATLLRYLRIDPGATPVFLFACERECVDRARATGKDYLVGPIRRMAAQLRQLLAGWDATHARLLGQVAARRDQDTLF